MFPRINYRLKSWSGLVLSIVVFTAVFIATSAPAKDKRKPSATAEAVAPIAPDDVGGFKARLTAIATKHLDLLLDSEGKVGDLKGKSADGMTAFAFYRIFEITGNKRYQAAALEIADRFLKEMKETKFGVIYIKEKEKEPGESISGGGPPAFGWYTAKLAYIYHKEGNREQDVRYIANVFDKYPWNEEGWWAATIDVKTGEPKEAITKPSPVNKNASMAMAASMLSVYVKELDSALSSRLKAKAEKCVRAQIIPAQEDDGFWHYGLTGNDPKNKDILGYFMVTAHGLIQCEQFSPYFNDSNFKASLARACGFASTQIAPMTDPNKGATSNRKTPETPSRYSREGDLKRGFALAPILLAGGNLSECIKIYQYWSAKFPYGDRGQDGAHALEPTVLMLSLLEKTQPRKFVAP